MTLTIHIYSSTQEPQAFHITALEAFSDSFPYSVSVRHARDEGNISALYQSRG